MTTLRPPIDPTPNSVEKMLPWSTLTDQLDGLPPAELRGVVNQFIDEELEAVKVLSPIKRGLAAATDDELAEKYVLAALKIGTIHAHASYPPSNYTYRIEPFFWHFVIDDADAITAIKKGIVPALFLGNADQSLERELANRPLFVEGSTPRSFSKLRPPSEKKLKDTARAIIRSHPDSSRMKKGDFINELMRRCPGCSKNRAARMWAATAPQAWRKAGRPKQQ
jgi:hypothetical protein